MIDLKLPQVGATWHGKYFHSFDVQPTHMSLRKVNGGCVIQLNYNNFKEW